MKKSQWTFLKHLRTDSLKDSVALHTFSIQLELRNINSKAQIDRVVINDRDGYILYKDFEFLKNHDFIALMQAKRSATMVIPVMILVSQTNKPTDLRIGIADIPAKFKAFMNYDSKKKATTDNYIYIAPQFIIVETKIYD